MNQNTLWFFVVILMAYFLVVFCEKVDNVVGLLESTGREITGLTDEARIRRKHGLQHWGWYALAIAYWVKAKLIVIGFFVGWLIFWAFRYFKPHSKCGEIDGPIYYDHPHSKSHYDHIPYHLDHLDHFDHHSFDHHPSFDHSYVGSASEPFSAYSGGPSITDDSPSIGETLPSSSHKRKRRSVVKDKASKRQNRAPLEEQLVELLFSFLGLDSNACRRRFICEMEFRSKVSPISSMGFRIMGRSFFEKYLNSGNGKATSFAECAAVNPECVFIEPNDGDVEHAEQQPANEINRNDEINEINRRSNKSNLEQKNAANLRLERRGSNLKRRQRGERQLNPFGRTNFSTND